MTQDSSLFVVTIDGPSGAGKGTVAQRLASKLGFHLLDSGADDYVTKPFDFSELEARCRAVLRRRGGAARNVVSFGGVEFDALAAQLTIGSEVRELRNRELRLLEVLLSSPRSIYSKAQLCDRLFSYSEEPSENAIEVYVGRLRKKLEGSNARIETVRGLGYRLLDPETSGKSAGKPKALEDQSK